MEAFVLMFLVFLVLDILVPSKAERDALERPR